MVVAWRAALCLLAVAACSDPVVGPPSASAERCEKLAVLYDRYGFWIGTQSPPGWTQRVSGAIDCSRGRYDSGIRELENALRALGFTPDQLRPDRL